MTAARVWKDRTIKAGFAGLSAVRAHRLAGPSTRGLGAILMFHHVRPADGRSLRVNRGLSITPEFLVETLDLLRARNFDLVSLDEAVARIRGEGAGRPFAALTFDDGYVDNLIYAAPILQACQAPYTIYVAPGFVDRSVGAWWEDVEAAVIASQRVAGAVDREPFDLPARTASEKDAAANWLVERLRRASSAGARACATQLLAAAGLDADAQNRSLFMEWDDLRALAATSLCTIGAHTLVHPRLAALDEPRARQEIVESKRMIEARLGAPVRHFAYPYGGPDAAGPREFALAAEAGFNSATTTRPGMIFGEHAGHLHALPRLSVNGAWQSRQALELLLSGLPFALWNRGRRLNVA